MQSGVPESCIDVVAFSTMGDGRFFSHRRDQGVTGRQAGVIALA
jgi:copper oxidase (laccase) domain-containing protein